MTDIKKAELKMAKALAAIEEAGFDVDNIQERIYHGQGLVFGGDVVVTGSSPFSPVLYGQGTQGNDLVFVDNNLSAPFIAFEGNGGNDLIVAGSGTQNYNGGLGSDTLAYINASSFVSLRLEHSFNRAESETWNSGEARGDVLSSIENVIGSQFSDTLVGNSNANDLYGADGNDLLIGGAGLDDLFGGDDNDILISGLESGAHEDFDPMSFLFRETLDGGEGNDRLVSSINAGRLVGGDGFDTADYSRSEEGVVVNLATGQGAGGHARGDTLTSIEAVQGSNFNDVLAGDNGANTLTGGMGNDMLAGGGNADIFQFFFSYFSGTGPIGNDTITDFGAGDVVRLVGVGPGEVNLSQTGGHTLITVDGFQGSITVLNTLTSQIDLVF